MFPYIALVYLSLCLMVGIFGWRTRLGFFRSLFFSVMVTPFVVMVYLLINATLEAEAEKKKSGGVPDSALPRARKSGTE